MEKRMIVMLLALFMVAAVNAQSVTVRGIQSENDDINLGEYKTFSWASHVSKQDDGGQFFMNDPSLKQAVRQAVQYELEARGYKMVEKSGDVIVNFRVFEEPASLADVENYGVGYWGTDEIAVRSADANTPGTVTTGMETIQVDAGTLIISILDREEGTLAWQGFAAGLIDEQAASQMNQDKNNQSSAYQDPASTGDQASNRETDTNVSTDVTEDNAAVRVEAEVDTDNDNASTTDRNMSNTTDQNQQMNDQYAQSGNNSNTFNNDLNRVKQAVHLIFEEFPEDAYEFTKK